MLDVAAQLQRIAQVQEQLRVCLLEDSDAALEQLTSELGSRMQTVLAYLPTRPDAVVIDYEQFRPALLRYQELIALVQRKLAVTGTDIAKARAAKQATVQYAVQPARTEAQAQPQTNLLG